MAAKSIMSFQDSDTTHADFIFMYSGFASSIEALDDDDLQTAFAVIRYRLQSKMQSFKQTNPKTKNFSGRMIDAVVANGSIADVDDILANGAEPILVIRVACYLAREDLLDYLISIGIFPDKSCLDNAVGNHLLDKLLAMGVKPSKFSLVYACGEGNLEAAKKLVQYGANVNHTYMGDSPMSRARDREQHHVVEWLNSLSSSSSVPDLEPDCDHSFVFDSRPDVD